MRIVLYVVVTFLVLLTGISIVFNCFYKGYVTGHIDGWVYKGTDSVYHASVQDVHINLLTDRIIIKGIKLWPDTAAANFKKGTKRPFKISVGVTVAELELDNLHIIKLLRHKIVSFGDVYIRQPHVLIERKTAKTDSTDNAAKKAPAIKDLTAACIHIAQPSIVYKSYSKGDSLTCKLAGGDARLYNWQLNDTTSDTTRILLAKSCIINGAAFSFYQPSMLYIFKVAAFDCNTATDHLLLHHLAIEPPMNNATFYKQLGHRTTLCRLHVPSVNLAGFDWIALMHKNTASVKDVTLDNMALSLYFSYVIPSHPVNMLAIDPHMLLRNAGLKINVSSININKGHITYTEQEEISRLEESVSFTDVTGHATNLTNIKSVIAMHRELEIEAHGTAFKKSPLSAKLKISLADTTAPFVLEADLADVEAADIRKQAKVLTEIEVDSLQIQKIHAYVSGNRDTSRSVLHIVYHDFKMKILRTKNDKQLTPMPIVSFVAKTFFVFPANPMPGEELRVTSTFLRRDVTWPYFGTIVKNVKLGAKHTLTRAPKVVDAITKTLSVKKNAIRSIERLFKKKKK